MFFIEFKFSKHFDCTSYHSLTILLEVLPPGHARPVHHPRLPQPPDLGPGEAARVKLEDSVIGLIGLGQIVVTSCDKHASGCDGIKIRA